MDVKIENTEPPTGSCGCRTIAVAFVLVFIAIVYQLYDYRTAVAPFEALTGREIEATGDGMGAIMGRRAVGYLNLGFPIIDDQAIGAVIADLKRLPSLHFIDLKDSNVTEDGMERLRRELPHCRFRR